MSPLSQRRAAALQVFGEVRHVTYGKTLPQVRTTPIALSDTQLALVRDAARAVPVSERDAFLQGIARHLGTGPSDDSVVAAIDAQLAINRLPTFLCDSTPRRRNHDHEVSTTRPRRHRRRGSR